MAGEEDNKKPASLELVRKDDKEAREATPTFLSRFSRWPWLNRHQQQTLDSIRETIEADNRLYRAMIDHRRTVEEFRDLPLTLEADKWERQNRRDDARRKAGLSELQDEIERKRLTLQNIELERQLAALQNPAKPESSGRKSRDERVRELIEEWQKTQELLRNQGFTEEDEEWILAQNDYESRMRDIWQR